MTTVCYSIIYKPSVRKALSKLDKPTQSRLISAIEVLATNPRPDGVKKLKGHYDHYRIRQGDYRIIYDVNDGILEVLVVKVGHRREIYETL